MSEAMNSSAGFDGLIEGAKSAPPPPEPRGDHEAGTPEGSTRASSRSNERRDGWRRRRVPFARAAHGARTRSAAKGAAWSVIPREEEGECGTTDARVDESTTGHAFR